MQLQSQIVYLENRLAELRKEIGHAQLVNQENNLTQLLIDTENRLHIAQKELAHLGDCGD